MAVLEIGGQRFAAGLDWLDGTSSQAAGKAAADADRPWIVYVDGQTGLASADGDPGGTAALGAALRKLAPEETWMALVGEGEGPWAVIRQGARRLLADGDRVYGTAGEAVAAFGEARDRFGVLMASPGLLPDDPDVRVLDHAAIAKVEGLAAIRAAPKSKRKTAGRARLLGILALVALIGAVGSAWNYWSDLERLWKPEPPEKPAVAMIGTATDADAFLAGCASALERVLLHLGAWETRDLVCHARFLHGGIVQVHPELRGRPAVLATWKLAPGLDVQAHRRLAEHALRETSGWERYQVGADTAWAVVPLGPAVRKFRAPPPYAEFRASVDREFGLRGLTVAYGETPSHPAGDAAVTVTGRLGVPELREIVSAVPGLEPVQVATEADGLKLVARKERKELMAEPEFEKITRGTGS